jgi:hypothetical protein
MRHVGLFFPGGRTGAGLLLIRVSVGTSLLIAASSDNLSTFRLPVSLLLSGLIAIGCGTRIATVLSVCLTLYLCVLGHGLTPASSTQVVTALALFCTGPGAFSVDAYAFGRSTFVMGAGNANGRKGEITARKDPPDWGAKP